jgi:hypothetical protein
MSEFRIGQVISKSLSVFFQNIATFTLIAAAVSLPFVIVFAMGQDGPSEGKAVQTILGFVLVIVLSPLATAVVLYAAFQHMRGRPVRLAESLSHGLARFLPLVGLIILQTLGLMVGLTLLFIPGLILLTMWYVAVPACVVEKTGPIRSLARSRQLTKGFRWKLFVLLLLTSVLGPIGSALLTVAGNLLAGAWGQMAAHILWAGLSGGFGSVLIAVTYYYLRVAKEGVDIEQIAAVFD